MSENETVTTTEGATETVTVTPEAETTPDATPDLAAEVEKWKANSRKNEERAKANAAAAKELEALKASQMTEMDKAVAAAKAEGFAEARKASAAEIVEAKVRAAATGRGIDTDALLEGLDRSRFIGAEDFSIDDEAIGTWIDRIAPKVEEQPHTTVDIGQGKKGEPEKPEMDAFKKALGV